MGYRVIRLFDDLQDGGHHYEAGDVFPRPGLSVSMTRIQELSGSNNKQHCQLIAVDDGEKKPAKKSVTVDTDNEAESTTDGKVDLATAKFFTLKSLAKKNGIDPEGKSAAELREALENIME